VLLADETGDGEDDVAEATRLCPSGALSLET
jgi:ferredoxin